MINEFMTKFLELIEQGNPTVWAVTDFLKQNDRIEGVLFYYRLCELVDEPKYSYCIEIIDTLERMSGYCSTHSRIGTADYHILE